MALRGQARRVRALAHVERGHATLVSRNGRPFGQFAALGEEIAAMVKARTAILDGEVVCLRDDGHPDFKALLFHRAEPYFYAFDVAWLDGVDLRDRPLVERKRMLRRLIPRRPGRLRYLGYVPRRGCDLFAAVCAADLEGIVAKPKSSVCRLNEPSRWVKVKNRDYSQAQDRHELFERRARSA